MCFNVSEILMESTLARRTGHLCRRKAGTTPYIRIQLLTDRNRALHHRRPPQITYPTKSRLLTLLIGCCLSLLLHPSLTHSLLLLLARSCSRLISPILSLCSYVSGVCIPSAFDGLRAYFCNNDDFTVSQPFIPIALHQIYTNIT